MKIVNHNATAELFAKAEELNQQSTEGWKCIYFRILPADAPRAAPIKLLARFDPKVVTSMLARMSGTAFFCDNGDVFILYRGNYNSLITRLSIYLWSLCAGQNHYPSDHQLFSTFELNGQWPSFYRFCEKRYLESLAESEEKHLFPRAHTPVPAELLFNDHVAGYLSK